MQESLSIVIPAYNEVDRLPRSLELIRRYLVAGGLSASSEVIVVDDGSTDGTPELVRSLRPRWPTLRLIEHTSNRGKGAAVRTGILSSRGEFVAFADADLSAPIEQLDLLLADLEDADVAIVSRAMPEAKLERRQSRGREAMGKLYAALAQMLLLRGIPDAQCGLKLYRGELAREIFARVEEMGILFDTEALVVAALSGARISQRPAVWRHDPASRIRFDFGRAFGVGLALLRIKLRHRLILPVTAVGPIRLAERSPAYPRAIPADGTEG
jgi:dolichyl-phosphate beta-glucosyltransferase